MRSQDLNSESDCFPPLPLFYMDSETMGDRNVRCLKNLALNFGGVFGAIFQANNERSKSTLVVRHFLLILAK